jgi:hypothetical protein
VGVLVEFKTLGDKVTKKTMVDMYEEEQSTELSIESRKHMWALIIYSFSITKSYSEIFLKDNVTIKDKNFEIFNGLRVFMFVWILLGQTYLSGY